MSIALDHITVPSHDKSAVFLAEILGLRLSPGTGPFAQLTARKNEVHADARGERPAQVNQRGGDRGFSFGDPSGHNMELLTAPEGKGSQS